MTADWNKWRYMKDAPLWQVVSLSFDINPDLVARGTMEADWHAPDDRYGGFRDEYRNRLDIAANRLAKTKRDVGPEFLRCESYDWSTPQDSVVDLDAFSDWAERPPRSWTLPEEFPRAASPAAPPSSLVGALDSAPFYVSPYLNFMVRAAEALNLASERKQHDHGAIREWLQDEWTRLGEFGDVPRLEQAKAQYIVALITPPDHQKGGANPSGANILPVTARIAPKK